MLTHLYVLATFSCNAAVFIRFPCINLTLTCAVMQNLYMYIVSMQICQLNILPYVRAAFYSYKFMLMVVYSTKNRIHWVYVRPLYSWGELSPHLYRFSSAPSGRWLTGYECMYTKQPISLCWEGQGRRGEHSLYKYSKLILSALLLVQWHSILCAVLAIRCIVQ